MIWVNASGREEALDRREMKEHPLTQSTILVRCEDDIKTAQRLARDLAARFAGQRVGIDTQPPARLLTQAEYVGGEVVALAH